MPWYFSRPSFYATVYLYNKSPIYGYITRSIKIHRQVLQHLLTFHQRTLIHLSSVSVTASILFDLKKRDLNLVISKTRVWVSYSSHCRVGEICTIFFYSSTRDGAKTTDSNDSENMVYKRFNFQSSVKLEKGKHIEGSLIGLHVDNLVQVPI
jgi:hypothetical protein